MLKTVFQIILLIGLMGLTIGCGSNKKPAPKDMVYVPSGKNMHAFYMDKSPITVAQFRDFVLATGYITEAEKFGNAAVFISEKNWFLKEGAYWQYPMGKEYPKAIDDHPVTQVSYNDAETYAEWAGKRLPTSAEWEHAASDGKDLKTMYNWGNTLTKNGKYMANVWQGSFPYLNTNEDGFANTSPVGFFDETKLGLTDISGNVWEWTSDWDLPFGITSQDYQVNERSQKVLRGGSFLCEPSVCHGYQLTGKSESTPNSSLMHTGFRCVMDIEKTTE